LDRIDAMQEPTDFGLSVAATLSRVSGCKVPPHFQLFWRRWREAVLSLDPRLFGRREHDPSDPSATHEFESTGSVRIGCRLLPPPASGPTRAGLVVLHGYDTPGPLQEQEQRWQGLAELGVATLTLRVRGYPGSTLDTGDLTTSEEGWIANGLSVPVEPEKGHAGWVLSGAVADVVCAMRALRTQLRPGLPVYMCGESFGGALAILASAQLGHEAPDRLVIGLPSLGDWAWRLAHVEHPLGAAADIQQVLVREARRRDEIEATLALFDTVLHAPQVRCPVLCKLAQRDEVVPAPSAAAVFNALKPSPQERWRFVTPHGHFDGGIANARRHALFERAIDAFLDPEVSPEDGINEWVKHQSDRVTTEPAKSGLAEGLAGA
jgi:cephalosporin-C deacetylase-like acetyl esterase